MHACMHLSVAALFLTSYFWLVHKHLAQHPQHSPPCNSIMQAPFCGDNSPQCCKAEGPGCTGACVHACICLSDAAFSPSVIASKFTDLLPTTSNTLHRASASRRHDGCSLMRCCKDRSLGPPGACVHALHPLAVATVFPLVIAVISTDTWPNTSENSPPCQCLQQNAAGISISLT